MAQVCCLHFFIYIYGTSLLLAFLHVYLRHKFAACIASFLFMAQICCLRIPLKYVFRVFSVFKVFRGIMVFGVFRVFRGIRVFGAFRVFRWIMVFGVFRCLERLGCLEF